MFISFIFNCNYNRTENRNWLSKIQNKSLNSLIIPGTHDSITYTIKGLFSPFAKTNYLNIYDQLLIGIRFIDLRCSIDNDEFILHHSFVNLKLSLKEVLDQCKLFLDRHPTEFIIVSIKEEQSSDDFANKMDEFILNGNYNWFLESRIPDIDEIRNKFILFSRYNSIYGIHATNWADNAVFETHQIPNCAVQDVYNTNVNNKIKLIKKFNDDYINFDGLVLNYTNIQTQIILSIKNTSTMINNKRIDFSKSIVVLDYANSDIVDYLINLNS